MLNKSEFLHSNMTTHSTYKYNSIWFLNEEWMTQKNDGVGEKEGIMAGQSNTVPFFPSFFEPRDLII